MDEPVVFHDVPQCGHPVFPADFLSFIVWSSDSDVVNDNKIIYYVNKNARMLEYNDSVTKYNMLVRQWPSSIVAAILHFTVHDLLPEDAARAEAPSVSDIFKK